MKASFVKRGTTQNKPEQAGTTRTRQERPGTRRYNQEQGWKRIKKLERSSFNSIGVNNQY